MLMVIKRNGVIEPFSQLKLMRSLSVTGDEVGHPISDRDLVYLVQQVENIAAGGREGIGSRQLYVIVVGVLYTEGYQDVAEAYMNTTRNAWREEQTASQKG